MRTCFELKDLPFGIKVEQEENRKARFRITYGLQVKPYLTYRQAAHELGECIFHALACEGRLNNEGA